MKISDETWYVGANDRDRPLKCDGCLYQIRTGAFVATIETGETPVRLCKNCIISMGVMATSYDN